MTTMITCHNCGGEPYERKWCIGWCYTNDSTNVQMCGYIILQSCTLSYKWVEMCYGWNGTGLRVEIIQSGTFRIISTAIYLQWFLNLCGWSAGWRIHFHIVYTLVLNALSGNTHFNTFYRNQSKTDDETLFGWRLFIASLLDQYWNEQGVFCNLLSSFGNLGGGYYREKACLSLIFR